MSGASNFDPYYQWLGIPPSERPINHYRLLGVEIFEDNGDVIAHAADRQMAHLKSFSAGPHSSDSQQVLNALAKARLCLLNAKAKTAYDRQLHKTIAPPPQETTPSPVESIPHTPSVEVNASPEAYEKPNVRRKVMHLTGLGRLLVVIAMSGAVAYVSLVKLNPGYDFLRIFYPTVPPTARNSTDQSVSKLPANLNKGLVAYYPFNGNAKDESGNQNDGEVKGAILTQNRHGIPRKAYAFDGKDDFILVDDYHRLDLGKKKKAWTISVWFKSARLLDKGEGSRSALSLLSKSAQKGSGNADYIIFYQDPGWYWGTGDPTKGRENRLDSSSPLPNKWQQITVNYKRDSPTNSYKSIFIDGELIIKDGPGDSKNASNNGALRIGSEYNRAFWKGAIDDIRIYNRALSAAEVKSLYHAERTPLLQKTQPETNRETDDPLPAATGPTVVESKTHKPDGTIPAVSPLTESKARQHQQHWADYPKSKVTEINTIGMKLKLIPPGEFTMGSPEREPGRGIDEIQHLVKITKPFYLSAHEVTQQQYKQVMGKNPSISVGATKPAENITWDDAVKFCRMLSELEEGVTYRLPTEAEWEYACRAGSSTAYSFADDARQLGKYAWYYKNSDNTTHPAGEKLPNAWGLYDMHGNVFEWCQDWYDHRYGRLKVVSNPAGPVGGQYRVLRGRAYVSRPALIRSASRYHSPPDHQSSAFGFRVTRTYHLSP